MKTSKLLTIATLLGALALGFPASAQGKGGGTRLMTINSPKRVESVPVAINNLIKCKTETRSVTEHAGGRGAFKKVTTYAAHVCPTCQTKEVSKGAGKLATRTLEHTCASPTGCCKTRL